MDSGRNTRRVVLALSIWIVSGCPVQLCGQTTQKVGAVDRGTAPEWYMNVPADSGNLLARGTGKSKDEQVAIDKAVVAARSNLMRSVNRKWDSLVRAIEKESGQRSGVKTSSMTLVGSVIQKQSTTKRGKLWTAFVLVSLPQASIRKVLDARLHEDAAWFSRVQHTKAVEAYLRS
jgi:hypothetical protein